MADSITQEIERQTQLMLRIPTTSGITRKSVFILTKLCGADLGDRLSQIAETLYGDRDSVIIVDLKSADCEKTLHEYVEEFYRDSASTHTGYNLNLLIGPSESPSETKVQVVRIIDPNTTNDQVSDDDLCTYATNTGLRCLLVFSHIKSYMPDGWHPAGILVESSVTTSIADRWASEVDHALNRKMSYDSEGESSAVDWRLNVQTGLSFCEENFLKRLPSIPALHSFPIDEHDLGVVLGGSTSGWWTATRKRFGLVTPHMMSANQVLRALFGVSEDGDSLVERAQSEILNSSVMEEVFRSIWVRPDAWYYQIPINPLLEILPSSVQSYLEQVQHELGDLTAHLMQARFQISTSNLLTVCKQLEKECNLNDMRAARMKIWFYMQVLKDLTTGHLAKDIEQARLRIAQQIDSLPVHNENPQSVIQELQPLNWDRDVTDELDRLKPLTQPWDAQSLSEFLKIHCDWDCFNHVDIGVTAFGLLNQKSTVTAMTNENVFSVSIAWAQAHDLPADAVVLLAIMPASFLPSEVI